MTNECIVNDNKKVENRGKNNEDTEINRREAQDRQSVRE